MWCGALVVWWCGGVVCSPALEPVSHFLSQHGRGLYTKPLYHKLAAMDKAFACTTYQKHKSFYHAIIRHYCSKSLGLGSD